MADSDVFVGLVVAASQGNGAVLKHLYKTKGLLGTLAFMRRMAKSMGKPFGGFATDNVFSAVPIACGPYAVRVRMVPDASNGAPDPAAKQDLAADFQRRLANGSLQWNLQLQPFVSEDLTPIEDSTEAWPSPWTTVARLTLPKQDTQSDQGQALNKAAEEGVFDPWQALAAHRPLGDIQRARKVVYFESQKGRGAA
jgi:hypothetical protein